jgi:hypothetical protein
MENKPSWYKGPGWYVNHIWWAGTQVGKVEKIWLCDVTATENTARMIARERGYYGERIECIEGGKEDENRLHD